MKTIETKAIVTEDKRLTIQVPEDVMPGEHHVIVIIEENGDAEKNHRSLEFLVDAYGAWPNDLTGERPEAFEKEARFLLALKLFEHRRISAGRAAELCGLTKPEFIFRTSRMGIPVVDLDDDQLDAELQNA